MSRAFNIRTPLDCVFFEKYRVKTVSSLGVHMWRYSAAPRELKIISRLGVQRKTIRFRQGQDRELCPIGPREQLSNPRNHRSDVSRRELSLFAYGPRRQHKQTQSTDREMVHERIQSAVQSN